MKKILLRFGLFILFLGILVVLYFLVVFSGGIKGVWYNITNPSFDPNSTKVIEKRNDAQDNIISDFNFIDKFSTATKYGIYNIDVCNKTDYSWKRPINIYSSLYICSLISQRYYGLEGEYENTVRSLFDNFKLNNKELSSQEYQFKQLFVEKDWLSDEPTVQKIIKGYNFKNPNNQVSEIDEILSMLELKNGTTVYTSTGDGYVVTIDFIDEGVKSYGEYNGDLYKKSDEPDLRDQYISQIIDNHPYGVIITIKKDYYKK